VNCFSGKICMLVMTLVVFSAPSAFAGRCVTPAEAQALAAMQMQVRRPILDVSTGVDEYWLTTSFEEYALVYRGLVVSCEGKVSSFNCRPDTPCEITRP